jgi:hypothetical protein
LILAQGWNFLFDTTVYRVKGSIPIGRVGGFSDLLGFGAPSYRVSRQQLVDEARDPPSFPQ